MITSPPAVGTAAVEQAFQEFPTESPAGGAAAATTPNVQVEKLSTPAKLSTPSKSPRSSPIVSPISRLFKRKKAASPTDSSGTSTYASGDNFSLDELVKMFIDCPAPSEQKLAAANKLVSKFMTPMPGPKKDTGALSPGFGWSRRTAGSTVGWDQLCELGFPPTPVFVRHLACNHALRDNVRGLRDLFRCYGVHDV